MIKALGRHVIIVWQNTEGETSGLVVFSLVDFSKDILLTIEKEDKQQKS